MLWEKAGRGAAGGSERQATVACESNSGRWVTMWRLQRLWVGYPNVQTRGVVGEGAWCQTVSMGHAAQQRWRWQPRQHTCESC
jgi:hypothetical protein